MIVTSVSGSSNKEAGFNVDSSRVSRTDGREKASFALAWRGERSGRSFISGANRTNRPASSSLSICFARRTSRHKQSGHLLNSFAQRVLHRPDASRDAMVAAPRLIVRFYHDTISIDIYIYIYKYKYKYYYYIYIYILTIHTIHIRCK